MTGTIVVEASPRVEDNQWVLDLADRHVPAPGMQGIVGIVGSLPLGMPHSSHWWGSPGLRARAWPGLW